MGKFKGSMIANYIDADYKKEKEWRERAERIKKNMNKEKGSEKNEHSK